MPAPTKIAMKEQYGVSNFCYAVHPKDGDTVEEFKPGTVKSGGWTAKININITQELKKIFRDNRNAKTIYGTPIKEILFDLSLLPLDVRKELLGEYVTEDGALFGGGGAFIPPVVSVGFEFDDTDDEKEYFWFLRGTFSLPNREASSRNEGVETNGNEYKFTPEDTIHVFQNGGKPRDSVVMYSNNETYDLSKWYDTVITPDNYKSVLAKTTPTT